MNILESLPPTSHKSKPATILDGIRLCRQLVTLFHKQYFVALTGGLLYKEGTRKDIDIIIYRNRQAPEFETPQLMDTLITAGCTEFQFFGFVTKCKWQGYNVDILNPETESKDTYGED